MRMRALARFSSAPAVALWLVVACVHGTGPTEARAASLRVQGFSQATNDPDVQDPVDESGAIGPISGDASSFGTATVGGGTASGQVAGSADYGLLRTRSSGTASGPFADVGGAVSGGNLQVSWTDRFTIAPPDPSLLFQPGTFVFRILLDGTLSASAGGALESNTRAQHSLFVEAGTCSVGCEFQRFGEHGDFGSQGGGVIDTGDPIMDLTSTPVPFLFGVGIDLTVTLTSTAQAVAGIAPFVSSADADLGTSLAWDGFLEVRDGSGDLVTGYTVSSDSRFDWSKPVPEPASAVGLALGLAALAARRRRTR
jgi:hypothetical protein